MKQHSYAFSNGYLWSVKEQIDCIDFFLESKSVDIPYYNNLLKEKLDEATAQCKDVKDAKGKSTGAKHAFEESELIAKNALRQRLAKSDNTTDSPDKDQTPLSPEDIENILIFRAFLRCELTASQYTSPAIEFPSNINFKNYFDFSMFPTLVYHLEYPRTEKIRWDYVAEKTVATFGVFFLMIIVAENHLYPIAIETLELRGATLSEKLYKYPIILGELIPPFAMMFLFVFYIIWETILNGIAELTRFADRSFYGPWWNCVTWDQFARDWNSPVHLFLLQHVYQSTISVFNVSKKVATLTTFLLSSCVHELVMFVIFRKLRGYLLCLQMSQLPLVALSRTRFMRDKPVLGNVIFWLGMLTGPSLMCSLYLTF